MPPVTKRQVEIKPFVYPSPVLNCSCPICTRQYQPPNYVQPESVFDTFSLQHISGNTVTPVQTQEFNDIEKKYNKVTEWVSYSPGDVRAMSWHTTCSSILRKLIKTKGSRLFTTPVDWIKDNLATYQTTILHPMDLGTIDRRLNAEVGGYTNPDDFVSDVRMVFCNALLFNGLYNQVTQTAEVFSLLFEQELASHGPTYMN